MCGKENKNFFKYLLFSSDLYFFLGEKKKKKYNNRKYISVRNNVFATVNGTINTKRAFLNNTSPSVATVTREH